MSEIKLTYNKLIELYYERAARVGGGPNSRIKGTLRFP
jgi:hypothetical protein